MSQIEKELHEVLLEIAPDSHDYDEQAIIVAEASEIYRCAAAKASARKARASKDEEKIHEARMMDALLQAIGHMANWTDEDGDETSVIDGAGLDPDQIVHRASTRAPSYRYSTKGFGSNFDILDESDLDYFLNPVGGEGERKDFFDDSIPTHRPDLFTTPGRGRHRSDSLNRRQ